MMRQAVLWGAGILLSAGLLSFQPLSSTTIPGPDRAVIEAGDGYGISECLTSGEACGSAVALSWCQSNGYQRVLSYRKAVAEDVTGAIGRLVADDNGPAVVIDCGS
ncbi:MAG: hypothetical protein ACHQAY_14540 [Hyphomicrobiales bacterium]